MPITGLTDISPSFKEIGRLRLGIPKNEMATGGPKEISYFRPDFRPDAADSFTAFLAIYGDKPTDIHIRLPFPQIERCWDAFYEVYNTAGMLGMADGKQWLYLRHNKTGELLVKDGMPLQAQGLPIDENGMAYLPFDKNTPVYSYRSKNGVDIAVYAKPTGRLKVIIPELKRAVFIQVITHSVYNCQKISSQLAGIEIIAENAKMTLPMVPMILSRRKELISVSYNGKKSMQEHYLLNIEIDPTWMEAQFRYMNTLMPGMALPTPAQLPVGEELKPEDISENIAPEEPGESDISEEDYEGQGTFFTDKQPSNNGHKVEATTTAIQAEQKPQPHTRPYPPETVKNGIAEKAGKHKDFKPNESQVQLLRYGISLCFMEDPNQDEKRHSLLNYLTGHASSKEIDGKYFKAIVEDWLKMKADTTGDYSVDPIAVAEAQSIVTAELKASGQLELGADQATLTSS